MYLESMENAYSLKGKNCIVTGGAKGIGLGITTALAHQGANVAIFARDEAAAKKAIEEFSAKYEGEFTFYRADVGNTASCREAVDTYMRDHDRIDVLVNNAGIGTAGRFVDMDEELTDWFECFNVDLHGAARMCYSVLKYMRKQGSGHIVNITSNAGEIINKPFLTAYASSKAAFNHFTKCLAAEVAPDGIRVNAIAPGFFLTNQNRALLTNEDGTLTERGADVIRQTPFQRFGKPEELCGTIHYLISEASSFVTGTVAVVDGGFNAFAM